MTLAPATPGRPVRPAVVLLACAFPCEAGAVEAALARDPRFAVAGRLGGEGPEPGEPPVPAPDAVLWGVEPVDRTALARLRTALPGTPVLLWLEEETDDCLAAVADGVAAGCLSKHAGARELREALLVVARGEPYVTPALTAHLIRRRTLGAGAELDRHVPLSPREQEVLGLLVRGFTDPEIAASLSLSRHTVHNHLARVRRKTGLHRRAELARWAAAHGLAAARR